MKRTIRADSVSANVSGLAAVALALTLAMPSLSADASSRPDGDPPGHGSQRLSVEAVRYAHSHFTADACIGAIDILAFHAPDPKRPAEDQFSFSLRSNELNKMRFDAKICLPQAAGTTDPRCKGEWEFTQARTSPISRCFVGRQADSGEVLLVARKNGLPPVPADGLRLSLRSVPKAGKGLAKHAKLKGRQAWIVESRGQCHAIDSQSLQLLYKGACSSIGWPEP